jgi:hypothetical protein
MTPAEVERWLRPVLAYEPALVIGFDGATNEMSVAYCIAQCTKPYAKRKMILYHAPQEQVRARLDKRLAELQH